MKIYVLLCVAFFSMLSASATIYYVSDSDGNDTYDGTEQTHTTGVTGPWKTIAKVVAGSYNAGDQILFKRGDTFTDAILQIPGSGSSGNVIFVSAYGTGDKPIFSGSLNPILQNFQRRFITYDNLNIIQSGASSTRAIWHRAYDNIAYQNIDIASTGFGIDCTLATTNVVFSNIVVSAGTPRQAIYIHGATNFNISAIQLAGTGGADGVRIENCTDVLISNIVYSGTTQSGIYLNACSNVTCNAIATTNGGTYGQFFQGCYGSFNGADISDVGSPTGTYITTSYFASGLIQSLSCLSNSTQGFYLGGVTNMSVANGRFSKCTGGGQLTAGSRWNAFNDCEFFENSGNGFSVNNSTSNSFNRCLSIENTVNGFGVYSGATEVTFSNVVCRQNGNKSVAADGCGLAAHGDASVNMIHCMFYSNYLAGVAGVQTCSGKVYNSVLYKNGGDWSGEGGLDTVRGGLYLTSTNCSWLITNTIFGLNYPRELRIDGSATNFTASGYNDYYPASNMKFASFDQGVSDISWNVYSVREPLSFNMDPKIIGGSNFHLLWTSPAINRGVIISGINEDYDGNPILGTPDIGPYEYQAKVRHLHLGSRTITIPE